MHFENILNKRYENDLSLIVKFHNQEHGDQMINAHRIVPSASTIKVIIMGLAFERLHDQLDRQVKISEENRVPYSLSIELRERTYSIHDLIYLMIVVSDNAAANTLIDLLGMDSINDYAIKLGLGNTRLNRKFMDMESKSKGIDNWTSLNDLITFTEALRLNEIEYSEEMIEILKKNRARMFLARFNEEDDFLAHKTGSNQDCYLDFGFDENITIAVAVTGQHTESEAGQIIGNIYKWYKKENLHG